MKTIFCALFMLLFSGSAWAAPYDLDSPPESYTWGESREEVRQALLDLGRNDMRSSLQGLSLLTDDKQFTHTFYFRQDKLVFIACLLPYSSGISESERSEYYDLLYQKFTGLYGEPSAVQCLSLGDTCAAVQWRVNAATSIRLNKVTRGDGIYTSHAYLSNRLYPLYEQELKEYGFVFDVKSVAMVASSSDNGKLFLGKRIRITRLKAAGTDPLILESGGYKLVCEWRDEVPELKEGAVVTVSGIFEGIDGAVLSMREAVIAEGPADEK